MLLTQRTPLLLFRTLASINEDLTPGRWIDYKTTGNARGGYHHSSSSPRRQRCFIKCLIVPLHALYEHICMLHLTVVNILALSLEVFRIIGTTCATLIFNEELSIYFTKSLKSFLNPKPGMIQISWTAIKSSNRKKGTTSL